MAVDQQSRQLVVTMQAKYTELLVQAAYTRGYLSLNLRYDLPAEPLADVSRRRGLRLQKIALGIDDDHSVITEIVLLIVRIVAHGRFNKVRGVALRYRILRVPVAAA